MLSLLKYTIRLSKNDIELYTLKYCNVTNNSGKCLLIIHVGRGLVSVKIWDCISQYALTLDQMYSLHDSFLLPHTFYIISYFNREKIRVSRMK